MVYSRFENVNTWINKTGPEVIDEAKIEVERTTMQIINIIAEANAAMMKKLAMTEDDEKGMQVYL